MKNKDILSLLKKEKTLLSISYPVTNNIYNYKKNEFLYKFSIKNNLIGINLILDLSPINYSLDFAFYNKNLKFELRNKERTFFNPKFSYEDLKNFLIDIEKKVKKINELKKEFLKYEKEIIYYLLKKENFFNIVTYLNQKFEKKKNINLLYIYYSDFTRVYSSYPILFKTTEKIEKINEIYSNSLYIEKDVYKLPFYFLDKIGYITKIYYNKKKDIIYYNNRILIKDKQIDKKLIIFPDFNFAIVNIQSHIHPLFLLNNEEVKKVNIINKILKILKITPLNIIKYNSTNDAKNYLPFFYLE